LPIILDVVYNTRDLTSGTLGRIAVFTEGAKKLDNVKVLLAVFSKIATFTRSISNIVKDGSINALAAIGKYLSIKIYKALDDTLDKKNPELPNKFYESLSISID